MAQIQGRRIRVRGLVQGVGFRPHVWRLARDCGLAGEVWNDGSGVVIQAWGETPALDRFQHRLQHELPPLARIDSFEPRELQQQAPFDGFRIRPSEAGQVHTGVVPDAATCPACQEEVADPGNRRYRYPFTNCTHCGPRLSILRAIPYDRANTSMAAFPMCSDCEREYQDPADRRFHAQPNACPRCGPRVWLEDASGRELPGDAIAQAAGRIADGEILAVKGIGGFHLACDATNGEAVARLRRRKRRWAKPFALMARDLAVIRRYCELSPEQEALLASPQAPILILDALAQHDLPKDLAPGQRGFGFMLPYSPLHQLLLQGFEQPLVFTSGNRSDEPQCTGNAEARERLGSITDAFLQHDRDIVNRVDDSVLRPMPGGVQYLRRARGAAPEPLALPPGFERAAPLTALGGELKNAFCLLRDGQAILSQHLGDLEHPKAFAEYRRTLDLYAEIYRHQPEALAVDLHPDYRCSRFGRDWARRQGLELVEVQHHHAHIAACMADNGLARDAGPVLGIALDGLGYGPDASLWGGELLLADYRDCRRLAHLRAFPMLGGERAAYQPWRNAYAQLVGLFGWPALTRDWGRLEALQDLAARPRGLLDPMLERGLNSPPTSSAGRWFDAVAAVLGICRERTAYEGQAAIELEASVDPVALEGEQPYAFAYLEPEPSVPGEIDPTPMWLALLADLAAGESSARIAARFHLGLARALVAAATALAEERDLRCVALSGGVFQNRLLFAQVRRGLQQAGLEVLSHRRVPANDGGLALGQALVAAARRRG